MSGIVPIDELLGSGAGTIIYHLLILLVLEATAGVALIEYRHTRNPDQYRIFWSFCVLLVLRVPLLAGALAGGVLLSPVLHGLEVASLALAAWAFVAPVFGRRVGRILLTIGLSTVAVVTVAFLPIWYRQLQISPVTYAEYWQHGVWGAWATVLAAAAVVLLTAVYGRLDHFLPAGAFFFIAVGNGLILFDRLGLGRLVNLLGYPLLAVAAYRAALQDLWSFRQEMETLSEESLRQTREFLFLQEISRTLGESLDLGIVLPRMAESVAHAVDVDRAALLLIEGEPQQVRLAAQYVPLQRPEEPNPVQPFLVSEQPLLDHVMRRRRQLLMNPDRAPSPLGSLYRLLGTDEEGPAIVEPLLGHERVLGMLLVGRDRSKTPFSDIDGRLCHSIASQVAAAVESARLYDRLEHQARRLAEALALQEQEAGRREAILESIVEGIIVTDAGGRAVLVNAAAERLLGATRDRVLGRPVRQLLGPPQAHPEPHSGRLMDYAASLSAFFELQRKRVHVSAAPVCTADGERLGSVAVLRDVTAEAQAEKAKRDFIATISHELRTPLTAILGYAEILHGGVVGHLDDAQRHSIRVMHDNARRMAAMADNLIAVSDAERGPLELSYVETDLALIAGEVLEDFAAQMRSRELTWSLDVEGDSSLAEVDPGRVRQILSNLVSNAVKFTYPGGHVTLGVATVADPDEPTDFCRLWVQDTGIGIPTQEQASIWERFYRADNPLKVESGGLGIGLTIVKTLVEAHAGRVWVESVPGAGSTFTVLLPVRQPSHSLLAGGVTYPSLDSAAVAG